MCDIKRDFQLIASLHYIGIFPTMLASELVEPWFANVPTFSLRMFRWRLKKFDQ